MGPVTWVKSRHCKPWLSRHQPIRSNVVKIIIIKIRLYRCHQIASRSITRRAWSSSLKFRITTVRIRVKSQGAEANLSLNHLLMLQLRSLQPHLVNQLAWPKKSSTRLMWRHRWRAWVLQPRKEDEITRTLWQTHSLAVENRASRARPLQTQAETNRWARARANNYSPSWRTSRKIGVRLKSSTTYRESATTVCR